MNIEQQLEEIELLQSMYSSPGEFHIEDQASYESAVAYARQLCREPPQGLSFRLCLLIDIEGDSDDECEGGGSSGAVGRQHPMEVTVRLENSYPDTLPNVYLSSKDLHRASQDSLNSDLKQFMTTLALNEPCILTIVEWIRDNAGSYYPIPISQSVVPDSEPGQGSQSFCRMWLYMHHIYSKTKRRNILAYASDLELSGFCLPGKPGVVCVEGTEQNAKEFYSVLRRWNWKSITCRRRESSESCDIVSCRKITGFKELDLDVHGHRLDLGQFLEYLREHKLEYMFKELFGVEGQSQS